jgi:hypothetical protein
MFIGAKNKADSFAGYMVGLRLENYNNKYRSKYQPLTEEFDKFCTEFLYLIIETHNKSFIEHIQNLITLSKKYVSVRESIHNAVNYILSIRIDISKMKKNNDIIDVYGAVKGFLMLSYIPIYTVSEIITVLYSEMHRPRSLNLANRFICAFFGLEELIRQGINVPYFLNMEINNNMIYNEINIEIISDGELENKKHLITQELERRESIKMQNMIIEELYQKNLVMKYPRKYFATLNDSHEESLKVSSAVQILYEKGYIVKNILIPIRISSYMRKNTYDDDEGAVASHFDDELPMWLEPLQDYLPEFDDTVDWENKGDSFCWKCGDWDDPCEAKAEQKLVIIYKPYNISSKYGYGIYPDREDIFIFFKINDGYKVYVKDSLSENVENENLEKLISLMDHNLIPDFDKIAVKEGIFSFYKTYTTADFINILKSIIPLPFNEEL